jgi:probable F420-dependent oxidoreductase
MTHPMKLDATIQPDPNLRNIAPVAQAAEAAGFDGLWVTETQHDPFIQLALAMSAAQRMEMGTAIALSFTRSPMTLAYTSWDLAALSNGRFILGIGTQVKAHNERRFSVPWTAPIPRLREMIDGMRAIWKSWRTGEKLNFRGEYYKFTLMTPFFTPPPHRFEIPIYIAGVNTGLCQLAGELCEGFHVHPLNSVRYLTDVVRPAIESGAQKAARSIEDVTLAASVFLVTGETPTQTDNLREFVRNQISFYASTPSYRVILQAHGWEDIGEQLSAMAARKQWGDMPKLITDEMIETFAIVAPPDKVGEAVIARYSGLVDRIGFYVPYFPGQFESLWQPTLAAFAAQSATA